MCRLLDFLIQVIEECAGKEFSEREIKAITELFDRCDGNSLPGWI